MPVAATARTESAGQRVLAHPSLRSSPTLDLTVAEGLSFIAARQTMHQSGQSEFVWSGSLAGEPLSRVTLASCGGVLAGVVDRPLSGGRNETYLIEPQPDGTSLVLRADDPPAPGNGCLAIPVELPGGAHAPKDGETYPVATAANPAVIDLLVVYTQASRARYGTNGIRARILQGIADANTGFRQSQVYVTLHLQQMAEVAYTETGNMQSALLAIVATNDGLMDQVHALRNQYGADLVVLVDEDSNYAGISYIMASPNVNFAPYAFSVSGSSYISYFTMHHEMGHNMGCDHNRANTAGSRCYPYSYGFTLCTTDGLGIRTVMSYPCASGSASRINYFSNPNVLYNDVPLGVAYDVNPANASENARSLNQTAHYVAAFRASTLQRPTAPCGLEAAVAAGQGIALSWVRTCTNEAGLKVERVCNGSVWTAVATLPCGSASYVDGSIMCATDYAYRVRAFNSAGVSEASNEAAVVTPPEAPPAPANLNVTLVAATRAALAWDAPTVSVTSYGIEVSVNLDAWVGLGTLPGDSVGCELNDLNPGTTYAFRVKASNAAGDSPYSDEVSLTTPEPPPAVPTDLVASVTGATEISLTWWDVAGNETSYRIERSQDLVNWSELAVLPPDTTGYIDAGLSAGSTYHYRVQACSDSGCSVFSAVASAATPPVPPAAPGLLRATATAGLQIALTWRDNSDNETAFAIERSLDGASFVIVGSVPANTCAFVDGGLLSCRTYCYRVSAWNGGGTSSACAPATATPVAGVALKPPSNLAVSALGSSALKLTWRDNSTGETGFQVERSLDGLMFSPVAMLPPNRVAWTNSSLAAGSKYYYRVKALNTCVASLPTMVVSGTTLAAAPAAPSALLATPGNAGSRYITVTWTDNAGNESAQYLQQSSDGVTWKALATLSANVTSYRHSGLTTGKTYYYRIRSYYSGGGYSAFSNTSSGVAP